MKELSIPFSIPNLEEIQQELLAAIKHDYKDPKYIHNHAFTYDTPYMQVACPTLMEWLLPRCIAPIRMLRYYVTPPHTVAPIHIDGIDPRLPFGINIPVTGCKNTYHTYYDTTEDNLIQSPSVDGSFYGAILPKDQSKLTVLEELEITRPYVINNEILHGIRNDSDDYRVMFTVRWILHPTRWRSIDECMNTTDLRLGEI